MTVHVQRRTTGCTLVCMQLPVVHWRLLIEAACTCACHAARACPVQSLFHIHLSTSPILSEELKPAPHACLWLEAPLLARCSSCYGWRCSCHPTGSCCGCTGAIGAIDIEISSSTLDDKVMQQQCCTSPCMSLAATAAAATAATAAAAPQAQTAAGGSEASGAASTSSASTTTNPAARTPAVAAGRAQRLAQLPVAAPTFRAACPLPPALAYLPRLRLLVADRCAAAACTCLLVPYMRLCFGGEGVIWRRCHVGAQ